MSLLTVANIGYEEASEAVCTVAYPCCLGTLSCSHAAWHALHPSICSVMLRMRVIPKRNPCLGLAVSAYPWTAMFSQQSIIRAHKGSLGCLCSTSILNGDGPKGEQIEANCRLVPRPLTHTATHSV